MLGAQGAHTCSLTVTGSAPATARVLVLLVWSQLMTLVYAPTGLNGMGSCRQRR